MFFIFNKKIILLILLAIFLSLVLVLFFNHEKDTVQTISLPITNSVIILDAGHGYPDKGAEGKNGITESDINLSIVLKLQNLLEQSGVTVVLTRSDENGIYDIDKESLRQKHISDLKNRVKIGNESGADVFVSIHLNKISQEKYNGWQTFFKSNDENSKKLAESIQKSLDNSIQRENKRVALEIKGIYLVKNVNIPTTIVECGFLSNYEEASLLIEEEYQNKLAWGIYIGIMEYFRQ